MVEIFSQLWMHIKLGLVLILTIYHEYLGACLNLSKLKIIQKHQNSLELLMKFLLLY